MKIENTLLLLLLIISHFASAQKLIGKQYEVIGKVNQDSGIVRVELSEPQQLYPKSFKSIDLKIEKGKFHFKGIINHPVWVSFRIGDKFVSDRTPIDFGLQHISLDTAQVYQDPSNDNEIMAEKIRFNNAKKEADLVYSNYKKDYDSLKKVYPKKFPDEIDYQIRVQLKKSYLASDQSLANYLLANPDSHYAMYRLYHLVDFGYNKTLVQSYQNLSPNLKGSPMGRHLKEKLLIAKRTSVGEKFPDMAVLDLKGKKLDLSDYKSKKYILVDLWYSHCAPCIAQFPDLKQIYSDYSSKGFELIAVSTDKEKFLEDWKGVIAKHGLPWKQFLDLNGVESKKLNVKIYPTNFLINQSGTIIANDISPIELKYLLREKLN